MAFLVKLDEGARFTIFAYADDEGRCKVRDYLEDRQLLSNEDRRALYSIMSRMAVQGVIPSALQCNPLEDGIFEFKARGAARLLWFYDEGQLVIATHGFVKKKDKTPREQIGTAKLIRARYLEDKKHENIRKVSSFHELAKLGRAIGGGSQDPGL